MIRPRNQTFHTKVFFNEFVANVLRDDIVILFLTSEVKNHYAYIITQDICNKFIEVKFVWDVWFDGQIVCFNIEHPSIINKNNSTYILCIGSNAHLAYLYENIQHLNLGIMFQLY